MMMENNEVVNAQPELPGIIDGSKSYMYEQLWKLCAGPLSDLPKLEDTVFYFPQGHIELVETSTKEVLNHVQPVFDLPSKLRCRVTGIELKAQKDTEEVFAMISLMPDTTQVIIPTPNGNHQTLQVNSFTKVLTASDTSTHSGFSVPRKHATKCLPPLDASEPVPQQELLTTDLHGNIWTFKHSFRGTPRRQLFTTGWSAFATAKKLVAGDVFIFLRGENGELRVGIRRAGHQEENIPSSLLSTEIMRHGVIADAMHAFNNKSKFVVVYKPRLSQYVVSYDKFLDAMNKNFEVGLRFAMRFEADDFCERRYYGRIIGVNDFSPHWKDSEWRSLQVQWDELASFPRPDRVSPWEIEHLAPSSNILQSTLLKNKRPRPVNEIGSSSSQTLWLPTLTQGQEIGQSSIVSPISVPQLNYRDGIEDAKTPSSLINSSIQTMPKVNYNNDHVVTPIKEKITTDAAGASVRLFGVPLTAPSEIIKDPMEPVDSYQKSEISKLSQKKKLGTTYTLTSPKEIQSKQFSSTRSCTKVHMQGVPIGRALDLSVLNGYDQLTRELDKLFDLKGQLQTRNQWEIVFIANEGDKMLAGDDPWSEICNMVKKIIICSKEEVKNLKSGSSLSN